MKFELIIKFTTLKKIQEFYKFEFKYFINLSNLKINYKKSNKNIFIFFRNNKEIYKDNDFKNLEIIAKKFKNEFKTIKKDIKNICGISKNSNTIHCFNDYTHQTCCLLGYKARHYSNISGNPIGKLSEEQFYKYFNRYPNKNDLTPWCTCIGSKVCSYYSYRFNDGTHIKFINNNGIMVYNLLSNCEKKISKKIGFNNHKTPGVNKINEKNKKCEYKTLKVK